MKKRKKMAVILCVLVIVTAIVLILLNKNNLIGNSNIENQNSQTDTAHRRQIGAPSTFESIGEEMSIPKDLPQGVKAASLEAVKNHSGVATVLVVGESGNFRLVLEAKLPDLNSSKEYFAWLSEGGSTSNVFKLGKLEKKDQLYTIIFEQSEDFSKYNSVIVTEELNDDKLPEVKVLEGSF